MSYQPQHPDSPCLLAGEEQVPAKIWELLRRNDRFRRVVTGLKRLDDRVRRHHPPPWRRAWSASNRLVQFW